MALTNHHRICIIFVVHLLALSSLATYNPPLYNIWDTRQVPYNISAQLDSLLTLRVRSAINQLQNSTCIRFEEKTTLDFDYLSIEPGDSCETFVGKYGGQQVLHLHSDCASSVGEVLHELLHTLGFYHEHQRGDRDLYIHVYLQNVLQSKIENNFLKKRALLSNLTDLPYDYQSLTHYGPDQFSFNSQPTIQTINASEQGSIGQRSHLTDLDIYKVQLYYNCVNTPITDRCAMLPWQPPNGSWRTVKGVSQSVGHMIEYSCDDGYTLIGPTIRSCLLDGNWLAYSPYCINNPISYCNFDDVSWCGWVRSYQGSTSDYWYLNRRKTLDTQTGPNNDHTTMASMGYFAYVEASRAGNGDIALLTSPVIVTPSQPTCFRFAYSMYGQSIGELQVYLLRGVTETSLFSRVGGQGANWFNETIYSLPSDSTIQIQFRLKMTGRSKGDIALDDLLFTECHQLPL